VTAAWAARRPDTLPALVVAVFLLADFLFQRPRASSRRSCS
jgi:hypothetical protein